MAEQKRSRGRPKGTGIDDTDHLEQVREMIVRDPSLKPTTAIKALGFENESVIRRLRDKYNATYAVRSTPAAANSHRNVAAGADAARVAVATLSTGGDSVRRSGDTGQSDAAPKNTIKEAAATDATGEASANAGRDDAAAPSQRASRDMPPVFQAMATSFAVANMIALQGAIAMNMALGQSLFSARPRADRCCPVCQHAF